MVKLTALACRLEDAGNRIPNKAALLFFAFILALGVGAFALLYRLSKL